MFKIKNIEIKNKVVFAPMAGISNISFRKIIKQMNAGLIYSEMVSNMGIIYNSKNTIDLLKIDNYERPISIQIFGNDVDSFVSAAKYIEKNIKPDIIDINMGCPVPKVALKSQAGSSLLKTPDKIFDIVSAVVSNVNTPITVKIRSGWDNNSINCVEVAKIIEKAGASAIAIHPRTRSQGYSGLSNWSLIKDVKLAVNIPVIGNGDIKTIYDAKRMLEETGCDAVMIGRAALGNPWFIKQCVQYIENNTIIDEPTYKERIEMLVYHYELLKQNNGEMKAILEIKTHALYYLKYIPKSKDYKNEIVMCKNEKDFFECINKIKDHIKNISL
ncbi:MAG: tRNA dihydrouridine synthase DusB [Tenericutes bacterium]|nr:tRNA dihydrouridine synthase DusB [Mycoplasmatota bacterium]